MGNDLGRGANRMALAAMSHVVKFDKDELLALQKEFLKLAHKSGTDHTISRKEFRQCLELVGVQESDKEILDRVFTMIDEIGDEHINFKEFITGVAPIVRGNLLERLQFAFKMYDVDGTGEVSKAEFKNILGHMNNAVSYFGDDMMTEEKLDEVVEHIFEDHDKGHDGKLSYAEFMDAVAAHPHIVEFVKGQAHIKGAKKKDEAK